MVPYLTSLVSSLPHELAVILLASLPLSELQVAIPIGIEVYHLHPLVVWFLAIIGNSIPVIILLAVLPHIHDWLLKQPFLGTVLRKKIEKTEQTFQTKYQLYGEIALVLLIALPMPIPLTGAWTASLIAVVFHIPFYKAFPLLLLGIAIAGGIVTAITLGAGQVIRFLF